MYIFMLNLFMISRHQMSISIFNLFRDSRQQMNISVLNFLRGSRHLLYISVFNLLKGSRHHMHINLFSNPRLPTIGQIFLVAIAIINSTHYSSFWFMDVYRHFLILFSYSQKRPPSSLYHIASQFGLLMVAVTSNNCSVVLVKIAIINSTHYLSVLFMDVYRHFLQVFSCFLLQPLSHNCISYYLSICQMDVNCHLQQLCNHYIATTIN